MLLDSMSERLTTHSLDNLAEKNIIRLVIAELLTWYKFHRHRLYLFPRGFRIADYNKAKRAEVAGDVRKARGVCRQLPNCYVLPQRRQAFKIARYGSVEAELSILHELHHSHAHE